jgi:DNA primase
VAGSIDRDELLARVDLAAVLESLSGPRTTSGRWHCPDVDHADEHPSVTVRVAESGKQTWRCWSGGHRGTAIDAVMANRRVGVGDAIVWLAVNYGHLPVVERPARPPRRSAGDPDQRVVDYIHSASKLLWTSAGKEHRDWLHRRGLDDEVLRLNHVGADPGRRLLGRPRNGFPSGWPAVVYPALDRHGRPVFFQARYLDPPAHRGKYDSPSSIFAANPRLAWAAPVGEPSERIIVLCEGIPDALVAAQAQLRAVGLMGASIADPAATQELAEAAATSGYGVVICFDSDEAGRTGGDRIRRQLVEHGVTVATVCPPPGRDITMWAGGDKGWRARLLSAIPGLSVCGRSMNAIPPKELTVSGLSLTSAE